MQIICKRFKIWRKCEISILRISIVFSNVYIRPYIIWETRIKDLWLRLVGERGDAFRRNLSVTILVSLFDAHRGGGKTISAQIASISEV